MFKKVLLASVPMALLLAAANPAHAFLESDIITNVKKLNPTGSDFNASVAREYRAFAIYENDDMWDYLDGEHFALKAQKAAAGQTVLPEEVKDWSIASATHRQELTNGRTRLMKALDNGARTSAPQLAAIAQARYDCWMEQQEENYQPAHIAACKGEFEQAMSQLETAMQAQPPMAARPMSQSREAIVFFDFDRSEITPEAASILRTFATTNTANANTTLTIEGHADRSGSDAYNQALSQRRAQSVRAELQRDGVQFDRYKDIRIIAKGESEPLVPTADGVREPQNRRVTVRSVDSMPNTSSAPAPMNTSAR